MISKKLLHRILDGSYRPQDKQNFSRADHVREMWQAFEESDDLVLKAEIFHHIVGQFQFQPAIDGAPDILQKVKEQFKGLSRIYRTAEKKEWAELSNINGHPCSMRAVGPFDEGVAAAASGKSIESNPHSTLESDLEEYAKWFEWEQGWKAHHPQPWNR